MSPRAAISVDDLRRQARARIPKFAFDFVDGGAGTEDGLARNGDAFRDACLVPRVLVNSAAPANTRRAFLGREWSVPFGIAPIGLPGLAWPGADTAMARAAQWAGAPFTASTPATTTLEDLKAAAPDSAFFQLYVGKSPEITDDLIARAEAAGYETLVVTADVPRPGKRLRDLRNGFALPLRFTPRLLSDLATHPAWSLATLRHGAPRFANLARYAGDGTGARSLAELMAGQSSGRLDWDLLGRIRERWRGTLVLKGVMHPEDAVRAAAQGVDAVQVSNHGGRQFNAAPATLVALREVRAAVPPGFPVAVDGGVRSGEDVLKALDAGADFVFLGRPFLYALGALGTDGPADLMTLLAAELEVAMAQTGRQRLDPRRSTHKAEQREQDLHAAG
ncbi:alpha-hydroxy acid oxidase [Tranquillimonas alkanivorans]|uniref:L-lactate dehydrogenase (Cytochrome) n=1 Tax=Tranquillimonas alkanivorans TaxID=441119 RepID=A0A1I5UC36_9RHOB|nr:alpha-hydroxy acid oxidase [Tranquillimonas alkanivorans]SFP92863.1 L-lactate dehydrogenase (cytochrome) [Tranquillimonas alkanivorans]